MTHDHAGEHTDLIGTMRRRRPGAISFEGACYRVVGVCAGLRVVNITFVETDTKLLCDLDDVLEDPPVQSQAV